MGVFGGKKTHVASTCYNLAGDVTDRPDYLKSVVVGAVIAGNPKNSLGDAIRSAYQNGPNTKIRAYHRWAEQSYNAALGMEATSVAGEPDVDPATVAAHIPHDVGNTVSIQSVSVDPADHEIWAEQWMLENHPDLFTDTWFSDYDEIAGEIVVTLPDTTTHSFVPTDFDKESLYISAVYNEVVTGAVEPTETGSTTALGSGDSFPSLSGWATVSFVSTPHSLPEPWTETHGVYSKTHLIGDDGTGLVYSVFSEMYQDQDGHDDGFGNIVLDRTWRIDTTQTTVVGYSPLKIFIYQVGSGTTALDDLVINTSEDADDFLPPIPVRINNQFLSDSYLSDEYVAAKAAYKKLMGKNRFDELISTLEDNDNLSDIDFAYVVPGVSLNVVDNSCRKYLYKFFASQSSLYTDADYDPWRDSITAGQEEMDDWTAWLLAQGLPGDPLYGTPEPTRGSYATAPLNQVRLRTTASGLGYDTRISWQSINEETHSGLSKPDAKVGEVWFSQGTVVNDAGSIYGGSLGELSAEDRNNRDLHINWQTGPSSWRSVTIRGLVHRNYVYGGKYVEIKAEEAMDDAEESGFLVPIHYETWRTMSARDSTQVTSACVFLVINSYQIVKQPWYATGIFKVFAFAALVVVTILYPPAGLAGAGWITTTIYVAGNIVATIIISKITTVVAVSLFGEKYGQIVAMIATFVMMNPEAFFQNGAINLAKLASADTLIALTSAVGDGVSAMIRVEAAKTAAETQGVIAEYETQSKLIASMYAKNIGDPGTIDPMSLTDTSNAVGFVVEPSGVYLGRTLMTGSDIAELSFSLLSDFTSLTLNTELPV